MCQSRLQTDSVAGGGSFDALGSSDASVAPAKMLMPKWKLQSFLSKAWDHILLIVLVGISPFHNISQPHFKIWIIIIHHIKSHFCRKRLSSVPTLRPGITTCGGGAEGAGDDLTVDMDPTWSKLEDRDGSNRE